MADRGGVQTYIRCLGLVYDREVYDWRPCRFLNCPVKLRHKRYQSIDTAVTAKSCRGLTLEGLPCSKSENCPINHAQWQNDIPTGRKRQERRANISSNGDSSSDGERALGPGSGFRNGNSDANNQARSQQSDALYGASQGSDTPMYNNVSFRNSTSEDHFGYAQVVQETMPVHTVPRPPVYSNVDTRDSTPQGSGPAHHNVYEAPQTPIFTNMNPRGPSAQGFDPVHYNTNVAPRTPNNASAQGSPPNVPRYTRQVRKPEPRLYNIHTASRAVQDAMRRTNAHTTSHTVQDSTRRIIIPGYEINAPTSSPWKTAQGPDPAYRNVRAGSPAIQQVMHQTFAPIHHTTAATLDQPHQSRGSIRPSTIDQVPNPARQTTHTATSYPNLNATQHPSTPKQQTKDTSVTVGAGNFQYFDWQQYDGVEIPSSLSLSDPHFPPSPSEIAYDSSGHRSQAYPVEVRVPDSSSFLNAVQSVSNEPAGLAEREGASMSSALNSKEFSLSVGDFDGVPEPVRRRLIDWLRDLCLEL